MEHGDLTDLPPLVLERSEFVQAPDALHVQGGVEPSRPREAPLRLGAVRHDEVGDEDTYLEASGKPDSDAERRGNGVDERPLPEGAQVSRLVARRPHDDLGGDERLHVPRLQRSRSRVGVRTGTTQERHAGHSPTSSPRPLVPPTVSVSGDLQADGLLHAPPIEMKAQAKAARRHRRCARCTPRSPCTRARRGTSYPPFARARGNEGPARSNSVHVREPRSTDHDRTKPA